ncbi:MAG: GNAT family N-acetyltransferase [Erysipelotrichaceae bacterium]|nr:GNAT family N-acetyltransferase [Erysipelotrichaceae bacterium]
MKVELCKKEDLSALYDFYNEVIDHQDKDLYSPGWTKDIYPSLADLERHLNKDLVYVIKDEDRIIGAGIVSLCEDPIYLDVPWKHIFKENEIAVLHLFAMHPSFRGRGLALLLLDHIIEETKKTSKAIHLDAVKGNLAAAKLYEKAGFTCIGDHEVWYEDTGDITVELFEYVF